MGSFTKSEQIVILIIVLAIILILGYNFIIKDIMSEKEVPIALLDQISIPESTEEEPIANTIIMVHISGQVYNPGLVELVLGDRVIDAVNLAGGLTRDADLDRINLAQKVQDEEKIYIPKIGEISEPIMEGNISNVLSKEGTTLNSTKININLATSDELDKLPGIGPVIAQRIIDYRSSTPFKNIEDLKNVSGIGDKIYNGLKELITVKWWRI